MSIKDKILKLSIERWHNDFVGISALDISEKIKISNEEIMLLMEELRLEGKGFMNENVTLYSVTFNGNSNESISPKSTPVNTHIFFPSKNILEKVFKKKSHKFITNGFYKNQLLNGGHQLELVYFDVDVLSKYSHKKEIYNLNDNVTGGTLRLNSDFIKTLNDNEVDDIYFNKIWYGKRRLVNGKTTVAAMLIDLSKLVFKEQNYWHSFQIDNPDFIYNDKDFSKFTARAYHGLTTSSDDPINELKSLLESINYTLGLDLFVKKENPYLRYPNTNTFKEFIDCNSELYKLIGPDNINMKSLKTIFLKYCKGSLEDLQHAETKRDLSVMQLFELILKKLNMDVYNLFKSNWNIIKSNRVEGDHKITYPNQNNEMYIDDFREICSQTNLILGSISTEFANLIK